MTSECNQGKRRMSGFEGNGDAAPNQAFSPVLLGQNCPQDCPQQNGLLGTPLSIQEVAKLIGCSVWTVRQRYVPLGLPHLRSGRQGKLIFYRNQVVRWIIEHQKKGGKQP